MTSLNYEIHSYIAKNDGITHMLDKDGYTLLNIKDRLKLKVGIYNQQITTEVYDFNTNELYHDWLIHDNINSPNYTKFIDYLNILVHIASKPIVYDSDSD